MSIDIIVVTITMSMLLLAAIEDLQTYHIPNYITFPMMGIGVLKLFLYPETQTNLVFIVIGLFILLVMAYHRVMGMGDIKLYMAVLLLNGFSATLFTLCISCVMLVVYACIRHFNEVKAAMKGIVYKYEAPVNRKYPFAVFTFFGYSTVELLHSFGIL